MQFLVLGWLVLERSSSSSQLGLVVFLYGVPNLALLLFGGIVADRFDRGRLLILTQGTVALLRMALATVHLPPSHRVLPRATLS